LIAIRVDRLSRHEPHDRQVFGLGGPVVRVRQRRHRTTGSVGIGSTGIGSVPSCMRSRGSRRSMRVAPGCESIARDSCSVSFWVLKETVQLGTWGGWAPSDKMVNVFNYRARHVSPEACCANHRERWRLTHPLTSGYDVRNLVWYANGRVVMRCRSRKTVAMPRDRIVGAGSEGDVEERAETTRCGSSSWTSTSGRNRDPQADASRWTRRVAAEAGGPHAASRAAEAGKTTQAHVVANEVGAQVHVTTAGLTKARTGGHPDQIAARRTCCSSTRFIDCCRRRRIPVPAMEDFKVDVTLDQGAQPGR
jgi:hypothetical protein